MNTVLDALLSCIMMLMVWRHSGSAVECLTLDRENTVTNPLHIGGVDGDSLWHCYATFKTKSLYLYFAISRDLLFILFTVLLLAVGTKS